MRALNGSASDGCASRMPSGQQFVSCYIIKSALYEQLRRVAYGAQTHPAVGKDGVVLEAHCGRLLEGKRAKAKVDHLATAQDKQSTTMGESTCDAGNLPSYRVLAGSKVLAEKNVSENHA